ncbi:MAG: type II toxin-antitoxin system VapC family toxin [Acidobacteriota bacterium]|nr:type II toxin-antitoxin system VapC family toxin [Acidobacteriota bacterium]
MIYLDSSAIVKLVVPEPESEALRQHLAPTGDWISSALARIEVLRALGRRNLPGESVRAAERMLSRIALVPLDDRVLSAAAEVEPAGLRSLDAIHLATALSLFGLGSFVTYDQRLLASASAAGLRAMAPA